MYHLRVTYAGEASPRESLSIGRAADVLTAISGLLTSHPGCKHVSIYADTELLFRVDCKGERLPARDGDACD